LNSTDAPTILYFGNDWFTENRTSSHQIARLLSKSNRVFYFECPGMRAPRGSGRDFLKMLRKLGRFARGSQTMDTNLQVRTLLQLPFHRFRVIRWLNRQIIRSTIRFVGWREKIRQPIAWFVIPHLATVARSLNQSLTVYYCTDDHASLPGVDRTAIQQMDEQLTRAADVVFVTSATLLENKKALNPNSHVSPHGVDVDHFSQALDPNLPTPPDIAHIPHPIVGFFGLIESWIDLDLVHYLARERPNWSFLLIGRVAISESQIQPRPNLYFIGKRSYESLPQYGKQFDVAMIPYRLTQQTFHANPLKLREYLALGKPIVSVSTPEIDTFGDVVDVAKTKEEFLASLDLALASPPSEIDVNLRRNRVAGLSWTSRMSEILRIVEATQNLRTISPRSRAQSMPDSAPLRPECIPVRLTE
jgi:glycosyltransferase involved in cell wall biosynthesis